MLSSSRRDWRAFNIMRPVSAAVPVTAENQKAQPLIETVVVCLLSPSCVSLTTLWTVCQSCCQMNVSLSVRGMPGDHVRSVFYSSPQCLCHWDGVTEIYCAGMKIDVSPKCLHIPSGLWRQDWRYSGHDAIKTRRQSGPRLRLMGLFPPATLAAFFGGGGWQSELAAALFWCETAGLFLPPETWANSTNCSDV